MAAGIAMPFLAESTIAAAQRRARTDCFVGRERELAGFAGLLTTGEAPGVVFVYGPGGIGKSSLLGAFHSIAENAGCDFARLDARQLTSAPSAINQAVAGALANLRRSGGGPRILALDHVERLSALSGWLRDQLLPRLPGDLILVLAGRQGPDALWRADPGTATLLTEYALEPLPPDAVTEYLQRRRVDCDQARAVAAFAYGYPLPLALAVDQVLRQPDESFDIARFPDLIRVLVQWLLDDVNHPDELKTLQACATVRRLDEATLAAMLARDDVRRQFDWLADQHYAEHQPDGLVIHDLVRELVIRDLRSRNLGWHHTLIRRAIAHWMDGPDTASETFRIQTVPECIYALRQESHVRTHLGFGDARCYPDTVSPEEIDTLADEVAQLEGPASRAWFEHWAKHAGSEIVVLRDASQQPTAFALFVQLSAADMNAEHVDPCLQGLCHHLRAQAPLRGDERVLLARYRMACGTHQALTPAWAELSAHLNGRMFTPGISFLASVADLTYRWTGMEENAEYLLLPDTEYSLDGRRYMLSAHDLRREPALEWAHNSVERVLRSGQAGELKPAAITLLSQTQFGDAVRHALRHYRDDHALAENPLLQSPALRRFAAKRNVQTLRALIEDVSAQQSASTHKLLQQAYLEPIAAKQRALASELYTSERSLRRHLREAQERLIAALWALETTP